MGLNRGGNRELVGLSMEDSKFPVNFGFTYFKHIYPFVKFVNKKHLYLFICFLFFQKKKMLQTLKNKDLKHLHMVQTFSFRTLDVPGEIRTPDRTLRRRMLYPAELLGHYRYFLPYSITVTFRT